MRVEFVFDYRSIYSYLANTQMKMLGAPIDYWPVDVVAVMKVVGNQPSSVCPPKARYAHIDAMRWARRYNVPLSPNRALMETLGRGALKNGFLSRAAVAAQQIGIFEQVHDALFAAVWAGSDDLATEDGRAQFAASRGIPAVLWDVTESPDAVAQLAANDERAVTNGVFGAPTFFVDQEMFFGNDRLAFVKDKLDAAELDAAPRTMNNSSTDTVARA
jgi:2-hydroxychromene-2-carboxylate isomerase